MTLTIALAVHLTVGIFVGCEMAATWDHEEKKGHKKEDGDGIAGFFVGLMFWPAAGVYYTIKEMRSRRGKA